MGQAGRLTQPLATLHCLKVHTKGLLLMVHTTIICNCNSFRIFVISWQEFYQILKILWIQDLNFMLGIQNNFFCQNYQQSWQIFRQLMIYLWYMIFFSFRKLGNRIRCCGITYSKYNSKWLLLQNRFNNKQHKYQTSNKFYRRSPKKLVRITFYQEN